MIYSPLVAWRAAHRRSRINQVSRLATVGLFLALCTAVLVACSNDKEPVTEEQFRSLLTADDILDLVDEDVTFETMFNDIRKAAAEVQSSLVASIDRAYALIFSTEDGTKGLTLTLTDFDSKDAAKEKYEQVKTATGPPPFTDMSPVIGDASVRLTRDDRGIGSIIMFIDGDRSVTVHTTLGAPVDPLISLDDLKKLAIMAEERLP